MDGKHKRDMMTYESIRGANTISSHASVLKLLAQILV